MYHFCLITSSLVTNRLSAYFLLMYTFDVRTIEWYDVMFIFTLIRSFLRHPLKPAKRARYIREQQQGLHHKDQTPKRPVTSEDRSSNTFDFGSNLSDAFHFSPSSNIIRPISLQHSVHFPKEISKQGRSRINEDTDNLFYFSLTSTPPRSLTDEFFRVLHGLVNQTHKPKCIFVALPSHYLRFNDCNWPQQRANLIDRIAREFGNMVVTYDCPDFGPATKILGLLHYNHANNVFKEDDRIIVVDDDILYTPALVTLHSYCHTLYQCDLAHFDQNSIIEKWLPLTFRQNEALFNDSSSHSVFGFLSFSLRFGSTHTLQNFIEDIVNSIPSARFHDDALFSLYAKFARLYCVQINTSPFESSERTNISEAEEVALRHSSLSNWKARNLIEPAFAGWHMDLRRR